MQSILSVTEGLNIFAALIVSFLVIEVGFTFFKSSIFKVMHPEEITI